MFILIILSIIFNIVPMVILPIFYGIIPDNVPAFVDFFGNTIVSMEKSYISILRLPIMGLLLSIICIIMYKINLSGENGKINKIIWSIVAFIVALKMGITSMEILFFENKKIMIIFNLMNILLILNGIMFLIYGLIKIYKNKISINEYKYGVKKSSIKIVGTLCVYIVMVFMPMYIN